jgi:hypothetical protein
VSEEKATTAGSGSGITVILTFMGEYGIYDVRCRM